MRETANYFICGFLEDTERKDGDEVREALKEEAPSVEISEKLPEETVLSYPRIARLPQKQIVAPQSMMRSVCRTRALAT